MNEVYAYLNKFDGEARTRLDALRQIVHELVPEANEGFSYGLIGYKLNGKPLIYFGGFKHHIGLYATPNAHEAFKDKFAQYKYGKGPSSFRSISRFRSNL